MLGRSLQLDLRSLIDVIVIFIARAMIAPYIKLSSRVCVCLSVCLSVASRSFAEIKTAKRMITLTT